MIINTKPAGGTVLIETYWNVNLLDFSDPAYDSYGS